MSRYQEEVLGFMAVFEEARRNNWGYVPLTREEILETAHELRRVIDPEIVIIAEVQGRTAGALLAIPNINIPLAAVGGRLYPLGFIRFFRELKRVREVRILAMAALQHDRVKGITAALMVEALVRGLKRGYRVGEASWVLEDNHMSNGSIQGAAHPILYKKYRIYEKAL
jgi:GNAT superfamily N-acetyltransferase